jgi:predicted nucleic acid-binding protein
MVIDASIGVKWVLESEVNRDKARFILQRLIDGLEEIIVPDLFYYEIANTFATKSEISLRISQESLRGILKFNLRIYRPDRQDIIDSTQLAKKNKTTVYDMVYAVVAKKLGTLLITADERFVKKTKFPHVKLLSEYSS